ncbi:MAG: hypothetical protein ACPHCV_06320, partial [Pseudohongiellaceae bacterium]
MKRLHRSTTFRLTLRSLLAGLVLSLFSSISAQEPVRIAFIDPLSGTFASIGTSGLKQLQYAADELFNSKGGILGGRIIEI